jgi:alcohol dehydrogenase
MGVGCSKERGAQAKTLGATNILIVADAGVMKFGVTDQIKKMINDAGLKATVFDGAEPNPTDENVHDGIAVYVEHKCDGIVTLGGGSSHDCGKGISLVVAGGANIRDYEGVNKSTHPMPPFLAINTTAGIASEVPASASLPTLTHT